MTDNRKFARRADDVEIKVLSNLIIKNEESTRIFRESLQCQIDELQKELQQYRPMLSQDLKDKQWWDDTLLAAKRRGVLAALGIASMAAVGGFFLGIQKYWTKFF